MELIPTLVAFGGYLQQLKRFHFFYKKAWLISQRNTVDLKSNAIIERLLNYQKALVGIESAAADLLLLKTVTGYIVNGYLTVLKAAYIVLRAYFFQISVGSSFSHTSYIQTLSSRLLAQFKSVVAA